MNWRQGWELLREVFTEFSEDDAMAYAAALAFYSALGLAPTVLLFLSVTAFFGEGTSQAMIEQVKSLVGPEAASGLEMIIENARSQPASGTLSAIIGIATIIFSASGIFAQLQLSLNRIWDVEVRRDASYWSYAQRRLLSIGMLFSVLFLLLVSLVVNAALAFVLTGDRTVWMIVNLVLSFVIYLVLFALIFKFLPDVEIRWKDVWVGAAITAGLFAVGRYLIGVYLGNSAMASSYGAAGSLVVLLAWVYYSAVIVMFGAEMTQVYARHFGSGIRPTAYAIRRSEAAMKRA